jgi:hypothetical protein
MSSIQIKAIVFTLVILLLPALAFTDQGDAKTVADQFVRLYFGDDNLVKAVELTSGDARAKLEGSLREIKEMKAKKPPADRPVVKVTLLKTRPISQTQTLYYYRVASDVEVAGMAPITTGIWLNKEGNTWKVTKFVQYE